MPMVKKIVYPKTSIIDCYTEHLQYIMLHLPRLFAFYNFRTAQARWYNYRGRQYALEEACNVLLHGGKKYNRRKRRKTKSNRKKKPKLESRRRQEDDADAGIVRR